ncbi:hypothetical protein EK21DRAFT_106617 [Setomelanomma holmii]|uniref:Uncharacterized protein n=1 Tax=Setomelanomma holmii TaxID=210430 RepID=A0A9P4HJZ5_9PLEO|nr:hypothetical protein EK21DRAFT_106617 [Setomelanomma holmii]
MAPLVNESITTRNQRLSPLLCLPAELRLKIYENVLGGRSLIPSFFRDSPRSEPRLVVYQMYTNRSGKLLHKEIDPPSQVLLVSRQVNAEAALLPFKLNEFVLKNVPAFNTLLDWLTRD